MNFAHLICTLHLLSVLYGSCALSVTTVGFFSPIRLSHLTFFLYIPIKFYKNKQGLQDDATRSMEIHSNPVTITFNIDIQIDITFKDYK